MKAKLELKEGVSLQGLQLPMRKALMIAAEVYAAKGKPLVITSTTDGVHSPGSLHYYGYAIDIRTRFFSEQDKKDVYEMLEVSLKPHGFQVFLEPTHIHIEYQAILTPELINAL